MGNISGATDILIAGDKAGGKLQKADQLGVQVWDETKLMGVLNKLEEGKGKEKAMDIDEGVSWIWMSPLLFFHAYQSSAHTYIFHRKRKKAVMNSTLRWEVMRKEVARFLIAICLNRSTS